jgi:uncharacterized protein (DUF305 family)
MSQIIGREHPNIHIFQRLALSFARLLRNGLPVACSLAFFFPFGSYAQQSEQKQSPVVVQPGAPGQPARILSGSTKAQLPPRSHKDIEFMQGMIMHHAQAVEMTELIESNTSNKDLALLGARISQSQMDEMNFMKRWLELRGEPTEIKMKGNDSHHAHDGHSSGSSMRMPGMLSTDQMKALKNAKGQNFDRLFLEGMIQHHEGALLMVKDLFDSPGTGQDAELFNFASDVDSGQRAEIKTMQNLLSKKYVNK